MFVFSRYSELLKPSARGLAIVQSAVDIKKFFVARCSAQQKNYRIAARLRSMDRSEEKIFFTDYRNFSTHCSVCEKKSPNTCTCTRTRDVSDVRKLFWKSFLQLQKKFLQQQKNFFWRRNYFSGKKLSEKVFAHKKLFWKSFLWSQKKFLRSRKDFLVAENFSEVGRRQLSCSQQKIFCCGKWIESTIADIEFDYSNLRTKQVRSAAWEKAWRIGVSILERIDREIGELGSRKMLRSFAKLIGISAPQNFSGEKFEHGLRSNSLF